MQVLINDKETTMRKGFISGIALTILVASGILSAFQLTTAQSSNSDDNVWVDPPNIAAMAVEASSSSDSTNTSTATTVAATSTSSNTSATSTNSTTVQAPDGTGAYYGLGDSVAAGLGLPTWDNATAEDIRCGRSPQSYVFEVGRQLKRNHVNVACSGATASDLSGNQLISLTPRTSQIEQVFAQGKPAVISITVGANDIGWNNQIRNCYTRTCGTTLQTAATNLALTAFQINLNKVMEEIVDRSNGTPPTVILTGYYNPVSANCTAMSSAVTASEVAWVTGGVGALNTTIQNMATTYGSFARYAPVDFTGHDICSASPWVQGLNDPAPLHPTAAGQQAIARAVIAAVNR
jgi:lysophospholipase L1-like esterase